LAEQAYAYVTLIPVAKGFQQKIATEMAGVGGAGGAAGKKFSQGFGGAIKGLIGPALVAGAGVAFTGFAKKAVSEASDLEESFNAVQVAFGSSAAGILKFGESAAQSLGVSNVEFNNAAVRFSAFAERIVGAGNDASGFIAEVSTRATDFASVFNIDVKEALGVFQSGLAGEAEPLKRFGINLLDSEVKAFAMANGIGEVGRELTETEKVQARYGLLMETTAKTQGDFANTSDGLANGMRILQATIKDTQAEVGNALLPALQAIVPTITPLVQTLAPVLTRIFETLGPIVVRLAESLGPLVDAFIPLLDVFELLVGAGGEILASLLPPLIQIIGALTPIILMLVEAFMPLVDAILPPLVLIIGLLADVFAMLAEKAGDLLQAVLLPISAIFEAMGPILFELVQAFLPLVKSILPVLFTVFEALTPIIQILAGLLANYLVPIISEMAKAILPVVVYFIELFHRALEDLKTVLSPVFAALKPIADTLLAIAGIKPGDLKKTITVTTQVSGSGVDTSSLAGILAASGSAAAAVLPDPVPTPAAGTGAGSDARKKIQDAIAKTRKAIKSARKEYRKEVRLANREFAEATAEISENFSIAVARATINRDNELAQALKDNTKRVAEIQADFAKRLDDIVKQSMQRLRDAYRSAVEINVASIFDGDVVAGSIDGTIEMMRRKLIASRQLLANAASLAAAGFSQTFIEQVVGAGTDVGNELAQSILNATPEQQAEMRNLFNSIETEASSGMDALSETIYEKNGLATQGLKDLYAETQNELVVALANQEAVYQQTMADILVRFDEAVASAAATRDQALLEAQATLDEALLTASDKFKDQLKAINKEFKSVIKEMKGEVAGMASAIANLRSAISSARSEAASAAAAAAAASAASAASASAGKRVKLATGGLVTGPTNALIGEAGPELVIPLDKFESWMNMGAGGGKALNYYAAPNQSLDSETELFNAMKRAKVVVGW
jgi:phage-related protein